MELTAAASANAAANEVSSSGMESEPGLCFHIKSTDAWTIVELLMAFSQWTSLFSVSSQPTLAKDSWTWSETTQGRLQLVEQATTTGGFNGRTTEI